MDFKPLKDRVLVRPQDKKEKTEGGIIIPDSAKEKPMEGKVVAVGSGYANDNGTVTALEVKVGDNVMFGKWSGTELTINGEEYLIIKESDLMGILN